MPYTRAAKQSDRRNRAATHGIERVGLDGAQAVSTTLHANEIMETHMGVAGIAQYHTDTDTDTNSGTGTRGGGGDHGDRGNGAGLIGVDHGDHGDHGDHDHGDHPGQDADASVYAGLACGIVVEVAYNANAVPRGLTQFQSLAQIVGQGGLACWVDGATLAAPGVAEKALWAIATWLSIESDESKVKVVDAGGLPMLLLLESGAADVTGGMETTEEARRFARAALGKLVGASASKQHPPVGDCVDMCVCVDVCVCVVGGHCFAVTCCPWVARVATLAQPSRNRINLKRRVGLKSCFMRCLLGHRRRAHAAHAPAARAPQVDAGRASRHLARQVRAGGPPGGTSDGACGRGGRCGRG